MSEESIVCQDPRNCDREHVGGAGGTPVHLPPDGKVVPGHFDHGVPSDAVELQVFDQRQGNMFLAFRAAVQRQEERVRHLRYEADQEEAVLESMKRQLQAFMHGYRL